MSSFYGSVLGLPRGAELLVDRQVRTDSSMAIAGNRSLAQWLPPHSPNSSSLVPLPTLLPQGSFSGSPSFWSHLLSREAFPDPPITHGASGPILHELWLILHESPLQPTFLQLTNIYMAFKFYKIFFTVTIKCNPYYSGI